MTGMRPLLPIPAYAAVLESRRLANEAPSATTRGTDADHPNATLH
jgi:hypothetical protein